MVQLKIPGLAGALALLVCASLAGSTLADPYHGNVANAPAAIDSGLLSSSANNATTFQALVNRLVASATTKTTSIGQPAIQIANGSYTFTSGVTSRPWIHLFSSGNVQFKFTSVTSGTLLQIHNEDGPSGDAALVSAGNGTALDGTLGSFLITGAGKATSTVGVKLGPNSYTSGARYAVRDARLTGLRVQDVGTGIQFSPYNTYLAEVRDVVVSRAGTCFATTGSSATNAGERMTIAGSTCGSSDVGLSVDNDTAFTLRDSSIDFATGEAAILFGANARYNVHYLTNLHLEGATGAYIKSNCAYASYTKSVTGVTSGTNGKARFAATAHGYTAGKLVLHSGFTETDYNVFARVTAVDTDWYETNLDYVADDSGTSNALDEVHNPTVVARNLHIVTGNPYAPSWPNAPAQALFQGNMTLDIDGLFVGGYGNDSASAAGMFMIDDSVNVTQARNIQFTGWRQMISPRLHLNSDPYFAQATNGTNPVTDPPSTWSVPTGGYSNMTIAADNSIVWSAGGSAMAYAFTRTGASNYGVLRGDRFNVRPGQRLIANVALYGGTSTGGQVSLGFVFWSSSNADLPILKSSTSGSTLAQLYEDATDPAYTGDRLWWAKLTALPFVTVPPGYDQASLELTVASVDSGTVRISYAGVNGL